MYPDFHFLKEKIVTVEEVWVSQAECFQVTLANRLGFLRNQRVISFLNELKGK
jgi:hypothetical protein